MNEEPLTILDEAIQEYDPKYVIGMFSGGHDSLVATHIAKQHPRFSFALHINTGIGIEETRVFVRETCKEWGIELREYKAAETLSAKGKPDPQVFEDIVTEYGFPDAGAHDKMYIRLKERPLRQAIRELERTRKNKTMLVTGVRSQESVRRTRHVEPTQIWEGTKIWVAPIWQFSKFDVNSYIRTHELRKNPVVEHLHMSGECLCGAYAHKGEKEEIRIFYPKVARMLDLLEVKVREAGFPWGWEDAIPNWWKLYKQGQQFLPDLDLTELSQMLCSGCEDRYAVTVTHGSDKVDHSDYAMLRAEEEEQFMESRG